MEFSPRAAELTTLLESRISHFYTHFQVDGPYSYLVSFFLVLFLMFSLIFLMEGANRKGKAVATTSAGGDGHNGEGDDERKRKEEDEAFRRLQIRKVQKEISKFLHDLTKADHPFPRSPSRLTVTERVCDAICSKLRVRSEMRPTILNALYTKLTIDNKNCEDFPKFINEMLKYLEEHK